VPSDAVHSFETLASRVDSLGKRAARLTALRDHAHAKSVQLTAEVETLGSTVDRLLKVEELFRALLDVMVVQRIQVLEAVVTDGFQTIFSGQDLHFESDIGPKYGKISIDFKIRQGSKEGIVVRGSPTDSFGGGPASVASLILRVLTLLKLKRYPFLILDEVLQAVSDEFVEPTGRFLSELAKNMGIHILLITHKAAYLDHATQSYQCHEEALEAGQRAIRMKRL
jgi:DNA repair ATPase RecN